MCENQSGFRDIQVGKLFSCQMSSLFDDLDFFPSERWDLMTRWRPSMNQWAWVWHGFQTYLEWSKLTHRFQTFWNHHLVSCSKLKQPPSPMLEHNHITVDKEADWWFRLMHRKTTWIQIWELGNFCFQSCGERASCLDGVIDIDQQRGPSTFTSSVSRDFLLGLQKTQPFHEMIDKTSPGSHRLFFWNRA